MSNRNRTPREEPVPSSDLGVRAAWLYHIEGLTQEEIARAMKISRAKVIRLLASARDSGVVRIRIDAKAGEQITLERQLVGKFGLTEVVVVPSPVDDTAVASMVGQAAGTYLTSQMRDGMSIGVGWGSTLSMSLKAIAAQPLERLSVVSLLGGMTH